jgi:hypothetical protein
MTSKEASPQRLSPWQDVDLLSPGGDGDAHVVVQTGSAGGPLALFWLACQKSARTSS